MFLKPQRGYKGNMYWPFLHTQGCILKRMLASLLMFYLFFAFSSSGNMSISTIFCCNRFPFHSYLETTTTKGKSFQASPLMFVQKFDDIYIPRKLWLQPVAGSQLQPVDVIVSFPWHLEKRWNTVVWSALDWYICQAFKQHFCHLSDWTHTFLLVTRTYWFYFLLCQIKSVINSIYSLFLVQTDSWSSFNDVTLKQLGHYYNWRK